MPAALPFPTYQHAVALPARQGHQQQLRAAQHCLLPQVVLEPGEARAPGVGGVDLMHPS